MKAAIFAILILLSTLPSAFAREVADTDTDAGSAAVNACFGACDKDNNQLNLTTSPYEVDKKYNEIMKDRSNGVIDPKQLQNGKATHDKGMDI